MPRFAPAFTKVSSGMKIFPRGDYELAVTGTKPIAYYKTDEDGDVTEDFVGGCQVNLEMVGRIGNDGEIDQEDKGEAVVPIRLYTHTEKAWGMTKGSIMSIMGYKRDDEDQFNEDFGEADFSLEGESAEDAQLGSDWSRLEGQHFVATLNKRAYKGREQQDVGTLQPVSS